METPAMKVTLVQHAAPLLITMMLAATPALAQSGSPQSTQDNGTPAVAPPSGTSQKATPHTNRSATARQPGETMQNLVEHRIADLHSRLRITRDQAHPWDQFAQVMRDNAREMDELYHQ